MSTTNLNSNGSASESTDGTATAQERPSSTEKSGNGTINDKAGNGSADGSINGKAKRPQWSWGNRWRKFSPVDKSDEDKAKDDEPVADEDFSSGFLKSISLAEWAIPPVNLLTAEGHPFYKQKGFYLGLAEHGQAPGTVGAVAAGVTGTGIAGAVGTVVAGIAGAVAADGAVRTETYGSFLQDLLKDQQKNGAYVDKSLDEYADGLKKKIAGAEEQIAGEKKKIESINEEKQKLVDQKQKAEASIVDAERKVTETKIELATAKKAFLDGWFVEADGKLKKLAEMNGRVFQDKLNQNRELYDRYRTQNEKIVAELEAGKKALHDQLDVTKNCLKVLGQEGTTLASAKFLISVGYMISIAAGWAFSVFTLKTLFGSSDIVFYLFDGLQKMAHGMPGNGFVRIFQWLGVLGIIAGVSLLSRSLSVHVKRRQKNNQEAQSDEYQLNMRMSNDVMNYSGKVRAKGWMLFWMDVLPIVFILGIVVIFLAFYPGYDTKSLVLDYSLSGIAMGGFIAMGMAGLTYLYIIKIIEPRYMRLAASDVPGWRRNWELTVLLVLFVGFVAALIFQAPQMKFPISMDEKQKDLVAMNNNDYAFISLLFYLVVSLLAGFCIGYGMRYRCLILMGEDLQNRILSYTSSIDRYCGPGRVRPNRELEQRADELLERLMIQLERRNDKILRDITTRKVKRVGASVKEKIQSWLQKLGIFNPLKRLLEKIGHFFMEIFLPSEYDPEKKEEDEGLSSVEVEFMYDVEKWEEQYFADLWSRMKTYQELIKEEQEKIKELVTKINELADPANPAAKPIYQRIKELEDQIARWERLMKNIGLAREKALANLEERYARARAYLGEGYELGILCVESGIARA